ncbi:helix-turn-helix transcriptional regulator [Acetoanaerobium noterae]
MGSLIRTMRKEGDIAQKELSGKVNISRSYLAAIESNIYP